MNETAQTKFEPVDEPEQFLRQVEIAVAAALQTGQSGDPEALKAMVLALQTAGANEERTIQAMLDVAQLFYMVGLPETGLSIAVLTRDRVIERKQDKFLGAALSHIAIFLADVGNLPSAIEAYANALVHATEQNDVVRQCKVWHNLGTNLGYAGLYREATSCVMHAIALTERFNVEKRYLPIYHSSIAFNFHCIGEFENGLVSIRESLRLHKEIQGGASYLHAVLNHTTAHKVHTELLAELGDMDGARQSAQHARQLASTVQSMRADNIALIAEGVAEVFSRQAESGITKLAEALKQVEVLKITSFFSEILKTLIRAHEHLGQHDEALGYLRQLLDSQRKTQGANILNAVKYHLDELHAKLGDGQTEEAGNTLRKLTTHANVLEGKVAQKKLKKMEQDLFVSRVDMLERMAVMAELRDDASGEHSYRVGRLASLLASDIGCDKDMVFMIDIAARLNDIGKVGIPDSILLKPGFLSASERDIMSAHAMIGAELLAKSQIPQLQMAEEIAHFHHEWWNSTGYPDGLAGDAIPIAARIVALADVFDALTHERVYRPAKTIDAALNEIKNLRGKQFDPELTDAFVSMIDELRMHYTDLDRYLGGAAHNSPLLMARMKIKAALAASQQVVV